MRCVHVRLIPLVLYYYHILCFVLCILPSHANQRVGRLYVRMAQMCNVNVTTNMLKAYLSSQPSSLSAFMISKTHIVAQKQCGRQLNTRACDSKSSSL